MNSGMIAAGNHGYFDSLRGAPPQRGSQDLVNFFSYCFMPKCVCYFRGRYKEKVLPCPICELTFT